MGSAPRFTWKLQDYRMNRILEEGEATSSDKAKAALVTAVRRAGGWRQGFSAGVTRPSGGGWFLRWQVGSRSPAEWEEWEPAL